MPKGKSYKASGTRKNPAKTKVTPKNKGWVIDRGKKPTEGKGKDWVIDKGKKAPKKAPKEENFSTPRIGAQKVGPAQSPSKASKDPFSPSTWESVHTGPGQRETGTLGERFNIRQRRINQLEPEGHKDLP